MKNLRNTVQLIGRLGMTPEVKSVGSEKSVAKMSIATNEFYKNAAGEKVTETQWHNLVAWGKTAEMMAEHLSKGSEVAIQGKLVHRSYEDKDGNMKYISEVKVNEFMKVSRQEKEAVPF